MSTNFQNFKSAMDRAEAATEAHDAPALIVALREASEHALKEPAMDAVMTGIKAAITADEIEKAYKEGKPIFKGEEGAASATIH